MEKVNWKVEGMSCTNCALTIHKFLEEKGLQNVKVNFIGGDVSFENEKNIDETQLKKGIQKLGYHVAGKEIAATQKKVFLKNNFQRFLFCLLFSAPMFLNMLPFIHFHFLMNPLVQIALTLPVYITGLLYFGRSAYKSITQGIPNMNVLITTGATAAFMYSLYGTFSGNATQYMFYETAAAIITLIFLGNWLEDKTIETTQAAIKKLVVSQKITATMIAYDDEHHEHLFPVEAEHLKVGDLILIKSGEQVPMDCKILWGDASINESIISGESSPVEKKINDKLIGGSMLESGTVKAYVTATGSETVINNILQMVKDAEAEKPPVQQMADKISAVFVPIVMAVAVLCFIVNYFFITHSITESLLRSIAVLVIACPCAMGLATPAAIAVGLGRGARSGILFKNAKSLEVFKDIQQVVFDKTGTITTGNFKIEKFFSTLNEEEFKRILYSLEKYSTHPLAKCISKEWKIKNDLRWAHIHEIKGIGIQATDKEGNIFIAGSYKIAAHTTTDDSHNIYLIKNNQLAGWIDITDEIRPEAKQVIDSLKTKNIKTILLSGDKKERCKNIAQRLGIDEVFAEQSPEEKLSVIAMLNSNAPVAMVGDGINDAPALAKATVGISLSDATQIAMQSAQVILMNHGLKHLPLSLGIGKHTYLTIKQNLFWAFFYNIIAIPVAAAGLLSPVIGAFAMGLSDVVLAINSIRLNYKKVV